ncbi:MAG TPA: AraC family transcriptional regulator [Cellvibrionaceae bacterium]
MDSIQAVDLLFRFAAIGQLILLLALVLQRPLTYRQWTLLAVACCAMAYLLLTAPIADERYGLWRPILLTLTDAFAYAIWWAAMVYFNDSFSPRRWPLTSKLFLAVFAIGYLYFFTLLGGRGVLHDVNHLLAIGVLVHLIYFIVRGLDDDLVAQRRKLRLWLTGLISVFAMLLAGVEFAPEVLRHHPLFGLFNATFILLAITLGSRLLLTSTHHPQRQQQKPASNDDLPPRLRALREQVLAFMAEGGYRQTGLGIKTLAQSLQYPEHQLRQLINQHMGYSNFSAFLNHYRLREAGERLRDYSHAQTSILTLALDLGYASVGPFNRAFKAQFDQTPSEYRLQFQNRR